MADTSFVSKVTQIATGWLQDLNNFFYRHTGFTSKITPIDADTWYLWDSVAAAWKTLSLANLKAVLAAACSAGWNALTATTATNQSGGTVAATTISASGLITATSGQIKFPATQNASADANTLDDYEEGTFTPVFNSTSPTYSYQTGVYTKVGNVVTISVMIGLSNAGSGTFTAITGLPFAARTSIQHSLSVGYYGTLATNTTTMKAIILSTGLSQIALFRVPAAATGMTAMALGDFTVGSFFYISGSYLV